jgi:protein-tyrosine phosphatase
MNDQTKISVLFVCMGNICRSPTAEGVFRHHVNARELGDRIFADSAGTHAYHTGEPPDRRAFTAAERRGISLEKIRARRVDDSDFEKFDLVIAMDEDNQQRLLDQAPEEHQGKVRLFLSFTSGIETEVPDPYYGGAAGFERVLDLVEEASRGLLETLVQER